MAYYERKHPKIVETVISTIASPDQLECIALVKEELAKLPGNPHSDVTDHTLFRFSRVSGFDVKKTVHAFLNYIQWRADNKVDTILSSSVPKIDIIQKLVPYRYSGFDKSGRPLYIEKTGKLQVEAVSDTRVITPEEFLASHIWGMEYLAKLAYEESLRRGTRVDTVSSILDLDGLGIHHRNAIHILKLCMESDSKYYPERMGKIYVINAPWIAPTLYQIAQNFVDDYTKSCVCIIAGNPKEELPKYIPVESLPKEYGGLADDIVVEDVSDLIKSAQVMDDGLDKQYVSYDFEKTLECTHEKGGLFTWYFRSEGDYDIDFGIVAISSKTSKEIVVKEVSRCVTSKGSYTAHEACKLVFRWDNNFSYLYGKNLRYHLGLHHLDIQLEDQQSSASVADETKAKAAAAAAK